MSNKEITRSGPAARRAHRGQGAGARRRVLQLPLAFRTSGDGIAVLFKSGAAVFIGMNPVDEEELIRGLAARIVAPLAERETESVRLVVKPEDEDAAVALRRPCRSRRRTATGCCSSPRRWR